MVTEAGGLAGRVLFCWTLSIVGPAPFTVHAQLAPSNPRWSPDGEWVVFHADVSGQTDIFMQRIADGHLERLTSGPEMDYGPEFSPDGSRIAFYSGSGSEYGLTLLERDGTERRDLGCGGSYEGNPHFSHDGTRLAFSSNRDGNHEIYVVDVAGTDCRRITDHPGNDWTPRFSPDDRLESGVVAGRPTDPDRGDDRGTRHPDGGPARRDGTASRDEASEMTVGRRRGLRVLAQEAA